jgi:hypothetical protein
MRKGSEIPDLEATCTITNRGRGRGVVSARRRVVFSAVGAAFVLAALRLLHLVDLYAVNVLFKDQWKFDEATLFQRHSLLDVFRWQHGPHRLGVGAVLQLWLEPGIRWNSRYEAFGIATILCLAAALALFLKKRLLGRLAYTDVIIPVVFLTPVQYQVLVDSGNPSHGPLPVILCILYGLAFTIQLKPAKYAGLITLNFLLIYTGFGMFIGFLTPIILILDYRHSKSKLVLVSLFVSLISLASFFIGYKFNPAADCFSPKLSNPFHYLLFVGFMFSTFIGIQPTNNLVAALVVGAVLFFTFICACAIYWAKASRNVDPANLVIVAMLSYSLLFCFGTAYGRVCLGLAAAQGSRYMSYLTLGFFGLYLASLGVTNKIKRRIYIAAVSVMTLMTSIPQESRTREMAKLSRGRKLWVQCYMDTRNLENCDTLAGFPIFWTPEPAELKSKLDFLERNHLNLFSDARSQTSQQHTTSMIRKWK